VDGTRGAAVRERGGVTGRKVQVKQVPGGGGFGVARKMEDAGRRARLEGNLKLIQWGGQPLASRFNVGFFAGPAMEKPELALGFGERGELGGLRGAKEPPGDVLHIRDRLDAFDIDADIAGTCECESGEVSGMREIEMDAFREHQSGLPFRSVIEADAGGRLIQVTRKQGAQRASGDDERALMAFEAEAGGTILFIGREDAFQFREGGIGGGQANRPNVNSPVLKVE